MHIKTVQENKALLKYYVSFLFLFLFASLKKYLQCASSSVRRIHLCKKNNKELKK